MSNAPFEQDALKEALAHLGAALIQTIPSDDQIIMDHVRAAHEILTIVSRSNSRKHKTV